MCPWGVYFCGWEKQKCIFGFNKGRNQKYLWPRYRLTNRFAFREKEKERVCVCDREREREKMGDKEREVLNKRNIVRKRETERMKHTDWHKWVRQEIK